MPQLPEDPGADTGQQLGHLRIGGQRCGIQSGGDHVKAGTASSESEVRRLQLRILEQILARSLHHDGPALEHPGPLRQR